MFLTFFVDKTTAQFIKRIKKIPLVPNLMPGICFLTCAVAKIKKKVEKLKLVAI